MKRISDIFLVSMVLLGLLASGVSCTKTVYLTVTPTPVQASNPTLTLTPSSGNAGSIVSISGSGWPLGDITVTFAGQPWVTVQCLEGGVLTHGANKMIPLTATSGVKTVVGTWSGALTTWSCSASTVFTVVLPVPTVPLTEGEKIADFFNDPYVNTILWEEWNIFNEFHYGYSLWALSGYSWSYYQETWYNERASLYSRAVGNYDDLASVTIPGPISGLLSPFWDGIKAAIENLSATSTAPYFLQDHLLRSAFQQNGDAWLKLRNVCGTLNIEMPWPLPPLPSWPKPTSSW